MSTPPTPEDHVESAIARANANLKASDFGLKDIRDTIAEIAYRKGITFAEAIKQISSNT